MSNDTCVAPGCEMPRPPKGASGPRPSYCSAKCRRDADYARNKDRRNADSSARKLAERAALERVCVGCGGSIPAARTMRARFCSPMCLRRNTARDNPSAECSYPDCERPVRARGICNMHWRREARAAGREKAPGWSEARRASHHKRRALKRGAEAESLNSIEVFERDAWTCGLCAEPVDPALAWPDPMSASLDHILPLSRGGSHTSANVQCAHLSCNVRKGNRVDA